MVKMTLGCDPEFFLKYRSTGHRVSAHNVVPGTKLEPHKLPNGGSVQADGTAVEFNTEPASSSKEFADNVESCLSDIRTMIPMKYAFDFSPVVKYGEQTFKKIPDDAKRLGCDPDYSAYTMLPNDAPIPPHERIRTGAGHLHIGWLDELVKDPTSNDHMEDCAYLVRKLDDSLFYKAQDLWARSGQEALRRRVYGKKGAFRPKPFGVEYRPLSNAWVGYSRALYIYLFEYTYNVFAKAVDPARFHANMFFNPELKVREM